MAGFTRAVLNRASSCPTSPSSPPKTAPPQAAATGRIIGDAINSARVLINEPGNFLVPAMLAEKAASLASVEGVTVEVFDERKLETMGMGLLLGVGRGSAEPPRMLIARYEPVDAPTDLVLGLVGKGVTFDTGGISIKPADGMERMKDDMAGGATVVAALRALALHEASRSASSPSCPPPRTCPAAARSSPATCCGAARG